MHASRSSSSSSTSDRTYSNARDKKAARRQAQEPTSGLTYDQAIAEENIRPAGILAATTADRTATFHSGDARPSHATTSVDRGKDAGAYPKPRVEEPNGTDEESSSPSRDDGITPLITTQAPSPSLSPVPSSGSIEPPWNSLLFRRTGLQHSPTQSPSSPISHSQPSDGSYIISSQSAGAGTRDSNSPGRRRSSPRLRNSGSPTAMTISMPPRSPVLSPKPTTLLSSSPNGGRGRSPNLRLPSPLPPQSISPVPGLLSDSGSTLAPRWSPTRSPNRSPALEVPPAHSPRMVRNGSPILVDEVDYLASESDNMTTPSPSRPAQAVHDYFGNAGLVSTPIDQSNPHRPGGEAEAEAALDTPRGELKISVGESDAFFDDDDTVMVDSQVIQSQMEEDQQEAMFLDDEGLTALEKIYLFSRSRLAYHRIYISRQLPFLIQEVSPSEAVDYVRPLLDTLGTDEDDGVKEVFVTELAPIMWWFFTHCQLVDHDVPDALNEEGVPYLASNAFTPLIGSLVLSANPRVGDSARLAVVDLLNRLQNPNSQAEDPRYSPLPPVAYFGDVEKEIIINEIMNGVVLGMARLDMEFHEADENHDFHDPSQEQAGEENGHRSGAPSPEDLGDHYQENQRLPTVYEEPSLDLYRVASRREEFDNVRIVEPTDATAHHLDYFHTGAPREPQIDADGWVTAPPISPSEAAVLPAPSLQQTDAPTDSSVENGESTDMDHMEGDPGTYDTGEEATVGRVASMSVVATIAANATMPPRMQEVFVQEVCRVASDPVHWVRREASFAIGALAKVVPLEMVTAHLLPLYEALVKDDTWHVRHSILFALPGILARVNATQRRHLTVPSLVKLSQDSADTVRSGLLEVLGEVIYTFRDDPGGPPRELVDLFIPGEADWSADEVQGTFPQSLVSSPETMSYGSSTPSTSAHNMDPSRSWFHDPERPIICAFNFPAVILALGKKKWPEIRGYYLHLAQNPAVKVHRTLAASLGEVAKIIGSVNAEKDLMPIFLSSIRSDESEIRSKVIEAMPKFAEALSEKRRETLVAELPNVWCDLKNWREREELARLLGDMASLVGNRVNILADIMKQALRDEVAAVRDSAVLSVPKYLASIRTVRSTALKDAQKDILSLAQSDAYRRRATFVSCALSMIRSAEGRPAVEELIVWDAVKKLASDPIMDVRIGVARLVAYTCENFYPDPSSRPRFIETLISNLAVDEASQVHSYISFLLDSKPVTSGPPEEFDAHSRRFAIFSKPPRAITPAQDSDVQSLKEKLDGVMTIRDGDGELEYGHDNTPSQCIDALKGHNNHSFPQEPQASADSKTLPQRPPLIHGTSTETAHSGTSRGGDSQASPATYETESPKNPNRATRASRVNLTLMGDAPYSIELSAISEATQIANANIGTNITLLTPPGLQRRVSIDAISNHSDSSDSSGHSRVDPVPRRAALHRISSDPGVSVASG